MRRTQIIAITLLIITFEPSAAFGQEYLNIDGAKYLGKRHEGTRFLTCFDTTMEIGKGTVTLTDDRCTKGLPPPFTGVIVASDPMSGTLTLRDEHGNDQQAKLTAGEMHQLKQAPDGASIEVRMSGRKDKRVMTQR